MKNLVVAKDTRIPKDAEDDYIFMSYEEFEQAANSEEGLDFEETLFFNIDSIDVNIYNALIGEGGLPLDNIVFYKFADQDVQLNFKIDKKIRMYKVDKPENNATDSKSVSDTTNKSNDNETSVGTDILQAEDSNRTENTRNIMEEQWKIALSGKSTATEKKSSKPAKVILFGSSKGGTGKTFTCLLTAWRYANMHPDEKIALADFDIIDGQVGITLMLGRPTMLDYYKLYKSGRNNFEDLYTCHTNSPKFSPNIDFYLAPEIDFPEVTNDENFWHNVFTHLITNYDTVFFDSGIDYLGKPPISKLYKIADKILITSNTSINSVKSVGKQLETLGGIRKNNVFKPEDKILDRVKIILTRVSKDNDINSVATNYLKDYANIAAAFGNMDNAITRTQWYQEWQNWNTLPHICKYLDKVVE